MAELRDGRYIGRSMDALAPFGVRHLDMPLTLERVWRAVHGKGRD
jgi:hypothetical protein